MRVRYYRHCFLNVSTNKYYRHPLEKILDAFCKINNSDFKNRFSHNGEAIFLLRKAKNCYLFIKTKDTDVIQAINKKTISSEEIEKRLKTNESIGFVSFICINGPLISFCSTHLGPTVTALTHFINHILITQKINDYKFFVEPLEEQIDREQAKKLKFVGTTSIKVNSSSSVFSDLVSVLGFDKNDTNYLDNFEIKIVPKRNKNISQINKKLLKLDNTGMEKYEVRARAELHDKLTEFRIENSLIIREDITIKDNEDIYSTIIKATSNNQMAMDKALSNEEENDTTASRISNIAKLHANSHWVLNSSNT